MKIKLLFTLCMAILFTGCYPTINGRVIDTETNAPIEGAVVMVEWTKTHGIGDHSTESYKVVEVVSDKEGKVKIIGCYSPTVNPPNVTVYKKGYVAWSNRVIFPNYQRRADFVWSSQDFKLAKFNQKSTHDSHVDFISFSINSSLNIENKTLIYNAFKWERGLALHERLDRGHPNNP